MENNLSPETQLLIKKIAIAGFIAVFLVALTWLALNNAQKKSRDIQRLSSIRILQAELKWYFYKNNVFPYKILNIHNLENPEKECVDNLCLDFVPKDPLTGDDFKYIPCDGADAVKCGKEIKYPMSYKIGYFLELNNNNLPRGLHWATAETIF